MKLSSLTIAMLIFSQVGYSATTTPVSKCSSLFKPSIVSLLSIPQLEALQKAAQSRELEILVSRDTKPSRKKQVIVIMGESHDKGKKQHQQEVRVLEQFGNRGIEGLQVRKLTLYLTGLEQC